MECLFIVDFMTLLQIIYNPQFPHPLNGDNNRIHNADKMPNRGHGM